MDRLEDLATFSRVWFGSGLCTVLIPLLIFTTSRLTSYGNNEDQNQDNQDQNDQYQNNCRWYQWGCRQNYNGDGEQRQDEGNGAPWWWWSGGEDQRREEGPSPAVVFCYCWSLLLFGTILYGGFQGIKTGRDVVVIAALFVFANLAFILMILMQGVEGFVDADGPEMEENGFYGQLGVLMYMSYLAWLIFSVVFIFIIRRRASRANVTKIEIEPSDYQIHPEPEVKRSSDV